MPARQPIVRLTPEERAELKHRIGAGVSPARELARARVLLKADVSQPGPRPKDDQIAAAVDISPRTVARVRAAFAAGGIEQATQRKAPDRVYARKLDGDAEARLVELACSPAPAGHARWSLRLLAGRMAGRMAELEIVDGISPETVRATLKNTS